MSKLIPYDLTPCAETMAGLVAMAFCDRRNLDPMCGWIGKFRMPAALYPAGDGYALKLESWVSDLVSEVFQPLGDVILRKFHFRE